jgi:hypothetical protein
MPKVKETETPLMKDVKNILEQAKLVEKVAEMEETKVKVEGESYPAIFVTFNDEEGVPEIFEDANQMYIGYFMARWTEFRLGKGSKYPFKAKPTTIAGVHVWENDKKEVQKRALKFLQVKVSEAR